ncbi:MULTISPECIES: site-specific integrase [Trichocoleus]|uniref:Site-specific integrase n=1 Tax=Trichocoleus desertorum GB2-A4 TaxID=2933944 RepID=A0ABV0JGT8_9CYAN|nr:site-specific integrase [Trichocoleus sp. FACHB-46]MBD1865573.1 site-specific integrase [Trichocoleus sp. FACHB-46]
MVNPEFKEKLQQLNHKLKQANIRVRVVLKGNSLYARATLPPKPNSKKSQPHQQDVTLNLKANPEGLRRAEAVTKKIGAAIELKEFLWTDYSQPTAQKAALKTTAEWWTAFETNYFEHHKRTATTEDSFKNRYRDYVKRLPQDQELTQERLERAIKVTEPDSCTRSRICFAYKALGEFAGIDVTFINKALRGKYSSSKPAYRALPSDTEIMEWFEKIPNLDWRWVYGMLATYGLRPHEVFHLDTSELEQGGIVVKVLPSTKTGYREVQPLYPEWIEQFNLREKRLPKVTGKCNRALGKRVTGAFRAYKTPFPSYNLRHCYAIRCIEFNIAVAIAACLMGHGVLEHTRTYQAWLSKVMQQEMFGRAMNSPTRPQPPKLGAADLAA